MQVVVTFSIFFLVYLCHKVLLFPEGEGKSQNISHIINKE